MIDAFESEGRKVMKMTLKTAFKRSILSWTWVLPETTKQLKKHTVCFVRQCLNTVVDMKRLFLVFLQRFRSPGLWFRVWGELTDGLDLAAWKGYRKGSSFLWI